MHDMVVLTFACIQQWPRFQFPGLNIIKRVVIIINHVAITYNVNIGGLAPLPGCIVLSFIVCTPALLPTTATCSRWHSIGSELSNPRAEFRKQL